MYVSNAKSCRKCRSGINNIIAQTAGIVVIAFVKNEQFDRANLGLPFKEARKSSAVSPSRAKGIRSLSSLYTSSRRVSAVDHRELIPPRDSLSILSQFEKPIDRLQMYSVNMIKRMC